VNSAGNEISKTAFTLTVLALFTTTVDPCHRYVLKKTGDVHVDRSARLSPNPVVSMLYGLAVDAFKLLKLHATICDKLRHGIERESGSEITMTI
jgi:hypothetical protein